MASVVLVDASDMKEYLLHLNEEDAKRAATDVAFALELLNAEKARQSTPADQDAITSLDFNPEIDTAMAVDEKSEDNANRWPNQKTEILLNQYSRLRSLFKSGRLTNKKCWELVANFLRRDGIVATGTQCMAKFTALNRTYRSIKKHKEETGQPSKWEWFNKMEELLDKDNSANGEDGEGDHDEWKGEGDLPVELIEMVESEAALAGEEVEIFRWPHDAITLLIEEAMKLRQLCESGVITQKQCWARVASALKLRGYNVSGRQCVTKFHCLRRTYKSISEYNEKLERGEGSTRRRMEWMFYDIVGKLLQDSWTCTLNLNDDDNALDLNDSDKVSDSQLSNRLNGTSENKISAAETDSLDNHSDDLVMECDNDNSNPEFANLEDIDITRTAKANKNEEPKWCDKSTRLLIAEFKEKKKPHVGLGKTAFAAASKSLQKKGYAFSPSQVEEYWQSLVSAFRSFGAGKPTSAIRIAPYYSELRTILGKKASPQRKSVPSGNDTAARRGVSVSNPPLWKSPSASQQSMPGLIFTRQSATSSPSMNIGKITTDETTLKSSSDPSSKSEENSSHQKKSGSRSRLKENALSMLRELKLEMEKQNREIQRQNERREAFCKQLLAQNAVMIQQRQRRNELLEELVRLRRN